MKKCRTLQSFLSGFFGAIIASGGLMGFIKASSTPSLVMGLSFGSIFILSGFFGKKFPKQSAIINLYTSLALASFFIFRFSSTWKFMPSGLMAVLSILMFIWSICFFKKAKCDSTNA